MIQQWITAELRKGTTKPGTIAAKHRTLHTVLGRREGIWQCSTATSRPTRLTAWSYQGKKRRPKVYQYHEYETLMAGLDPWWRPLCLLCAETGMRWGELMGLHVSDFSQDFETIIVQRVLLELTKADTGNGTMFEEKGTTKEDEDKTIRIVPEAAAVIRMLVRDRQLLPQDRLFSMPGRNGLPKRSVELRGYARGVPRPARPARRSSRHSWRFAAAGAAIVALGVAARIAGVGSFEAYPTIALDADPATLALAAALPLLAAAPYAGLDRRYRGRG